MLTNGSCRVEQLNPLAIWLATTSLWLTVPCDGRAQPAVPGAASTSDVAGELNTNPPAIAGSLAAIAGTVSFHAAGESQWSPATLNYPVTNGEGFWTEPQASATIDIADDKVVLDESTELDVTTLDQNQFTATEAQGAIYVQLNSVRLGQTLTISTPRGNVEISQAGQYEVVAGDTNDATTITVVSGAAHIQNATLSLDVGPNQTATITGSDKLQGSVGPFQEDAFLQAQLAQPTPQQAIASIPQECRDMTGGQQLASYGNFTQSPQYGQVWYPSNVPSDWAPYRDGHWAYVAPWGWNWVDNARWGFAPFHYGRWARIDGRWGWLPSGGAPYVAGTYPIYSPALVAFVGVGAASLGFGDGEWAAGGYAPAWVPLGPREPYYPWYHFREEYFASINSFYGVPRTIIERGPTYYNSVNFRETNIFINRRAATVVPASVFARGQSVMAVAHAVPERAFAEARPIAGRLPVRPTAVTPNIPPEAARRFNIAVVAHPVHVTAGPKIVPHAPGARAVPELRRVALPQNAHPIPPVSRQGQIGLRRPDQEGFGPSEPPRPADAVSSAGRGLPALRSRGGRPETLTRPATPSEQGSAELPHPRGTIAPVTPHGPELSRSAPGHPPTETRAVERHAPQETQLPHEQPRPIVPTDSPRAIAHGPSLREGPPATARSQPHPAPRPELTHKEAPRPNVQSEVHVARRQDVHPLPHVEPKHSEAHAESAPHPAARPAGHPDEQHTDEKHPHH